METDGFTGSAPGASPIAPTSAGRDEKWTPEPTRTRFWLVRKPDGDVAASYVSESDARLIAAAPELHAALEDLLECWFDSKPLMQPVKRARAALKLARGE